MSYTVNDFDPESSGMDWYPEAAGPEIETTWGGVNSWKGDLANLQFMRAQTAWLEAEQRKRSSSLPKRLPRSASVGLLSLSIHSPSD
jgi:hypothetical protein